LPTVSSRQEFSFSFGDHHDQYRPSRPSRHRRHRWRCDRHAGDEGWLAQSAAGSGDADRKTTDQIEPRVDLLNASASANITSDANNQYIINNPGSYYLSANLVVTKANAINIAASGVTLDLRGFELAGTGAADAGTGISVASGVQRVSVSDGTLHGVFNAIDAHLANACRFSRLIATQCVDIAFLCRPSTTMEFCVARNNSAIGFNLDNASVLSDCVADSNARSGIQVGDSSIITRCVAYNNTGISAISTGVGCTLSDCQAVQNGTNTLSLVAAIDAPDNSVLTRCAAVGNYATYGISLGFGSVATQCIANENIGNDVASAGFGLVERSAAYGCRALFNVTIHSSPNEQMGVGFLCLRNECLVEDCTAVGNSGDGICTGDAVSNTGVFYCRVSRCEANENGFDGIRIVGSDVTVADNRCIKNAVFGLHVQSGTSNIIARNQLLGNTFSGLRIDSTISLVYANLARGNAENYDVVFGNRIGTVVAPMTSSASGNTGGAAFSNDPYANIGF
jgi:Right handed beta helix region